jgi:ABC-type branched-subunit amino acid transport system substrate-binding protein
VFDEVNAQGGIHGRQVVMVYRDDRYEPGLTVKNTRRFLEQDKVFALFGYVGTPTLKAALPDIEKHQVPMIAPLTGAQLIRNPINRLIVNVRASYHQETEAIVSYLVRYGRRDLAIVYQDDAFGRDGLTGALKAMAKRQLRPVSVQTVKRNSKQTMEVARRVALARPDAVLLISTYGTVASFIKNLRSHGNDAQVMNVSFVGSNALSRALPAHLRHGIGISQVVPFPWNPRLPVVRDYQNTIRRNRSTAKYGFSSLEGYLAATALVKALKQAGPNPTRAGLIQAFDQLNDIDLGGYRINLGADRHNGGNDVSLSFLMGRQGAFFH